ncbi:lipopolysaccharide export system permease protein [Devosia subaequoris]|uniref:Lipopolysaccharide export system permease protein n=1 Tax=Devosia subaequoris TaxID=395930 RepID=A0A7W6N9W2_9HYPH|nr:LptF/LptG family permease [Devosia subaequoris]MBB4050874.1 lipopolysaccharide export system permease protein [Devosia subaequoris]MCP1208449.1 LptF/LptG family permease [Devosia subaequoris]
MISHIDRVIIARLTSRIAATVFIFYGLIALVESLDTWRFSHVADERGVHMAIVMVAMSAVRWTIKTLPVTVLMGTILGLIDLKMRHELTVIKASGLSIWRVLRAPVAVLFVASLVIALGAETISTTINRELAPTPPGQVTQLTPPGEVWLEQRGDNVHYVLMGRGMSQGGSRLADVTLFHLGPSETPRIEADQAILEGGFWIFPEASLRAPDGPIQIKQNVRVPTQSTAAEISLKLASTEDMTFFELAQLLQRGVSDPSIYASTSMRLIKLLALPLVLTGSLLIGFAFTAGYSRHAQVGPAVLYGIVLGFVVFIITEMADRAGATGVLDPLFAAIGPALVAIVIGVTVLLRKEDGWT